MLDIRALAASNGRPPPSSGLGRRERPSDGATAFGPSSPTAASSAALPRHTTTHDNQCYVKLEEIGRNTILPRVFPSVAGEEVEERRRDGIGLLVEHHVGAVCEDDLLALRQDREQLVR